MLISSFGKNLKVTILGGSHEPEMKLLIEGLPSGLEINMSYTKKLLQERQPDPSLGGTPRLEKDIPYMKTGDCYKMVEDSIVSSSCMDFMVKNESVNSKEYNLNLPRPGHVDFPAHIKYKGEINMSGGGPFSGRMTVMLCIAGGIALEILDKMGITIGAQALSIGQSRNRALDPVMPSPSPISPAMKEEILLAKASGNSVGGILEAFAINLPCGLGGPMYDGVESLLSPILYGIPGVRGVEFGNGFAASFLTGSENNDDFISSKDNRILTATNNHGGILGGLTTGMPLIVRIGLKPTPSIAKPQQTVNLKTGKPEILKTHGRHDGCIVPRAIPVVKAALAVGLLDIILQDLDGLENLKSDYLEAKRQSINYIDDEILKLLKTRMSISKEIGKYKSENNISIENALREKAILSKVGSDFENIYLEIFKRSKALQNRLDNPIVEEDEK